MIAAARHAVRLVPAVALLAASTAAQSWPEPIFDAPLVVLSNNADSMIEVLDANGDGAAEAASVRIDGYTPTSYLTVRSRALQGADPRLYHFGTVATPDTREPYSAVGELFQPDGMDDLVVAVGLDAWLFRGATGGIARALVVTSATTVLGTAIGDFDGDGLGDLALLTRQALSVHLALPGASGSLAPPVSMPLPAGSGPHLLRAEVNGDGRQDLVVVGANADLYTFAAGRLVAAGSLPVHAGEPMPVAGDIDGDGDEDIVVFDRSDYVVLRRTGPATFAAEPRVAGGPAAHLFDVDGDGDLDGVCCSGGGGPPLHLYRPMTFRVSINRGGVFDAAYELHGIGGFHLAGVVDVNRDGFLDLVAGRAVYFARQSLGRPPHAAGPAGPVSPNSVCDVDGDGDPDWLTDPAAVYDNRGDGRAERRALTLLQPPAPGTAYGPPVIPGDFDGDGDEDLIVEVVAGATPVGTRLLLQRGPAYADGGAPFPPFVTLSHWVGTDAGRLVAADLDGDGDVDLASRSPALPLWSHLWHNDGTGSFAFAGALDGEQVVAVRDFTGDGRPDLIVSDGRLLLRRGVPGGYAAAEGLIHGGYFNHPSSFDPLRDSIAIADFDRDGLLDVVAAGRSGGGCWPVVLLGRGASVPPFVGRGSLNGLQGINSAEPARILAGDVNGDGLPDIVVSNPFNAGWNGAGVVLATGSAQIFDGNGAQQFMLPVHALADLDGDGDLDALGPAIARNRAREGTASGVREQWGNGTAGTGGVEPLLGASRAGVVGEPLELRLTGAPGRAWGILALGVQTRAVPMFGGASLIEPLHGEFVLCDGATAAAGDGRARLGLGPLPASLLGHTFHLQGLVHDAGSAQVFTLTNALTLTIGG